MKRGGSTLAEGGSMDLVTHSCWATETTQYDSIQHSMAHWKSSGEITYNCRFSCVNACLMDNLAFYTEGSPRAIWNKGNLTRTCNMCIRHWIRYLI